MRRDAAVGLLVALLGCGGDPAPVLTEVTLALPPGDLLASEDLDALEISVLGEGEGACVAISTWLGQRCDGVAAPEPALWAQGVTSLGRSEALELHAETDGPWEIAVRGSDATGAAFLYGCAAAAPGSGTTVRLWRAWDDVDVCLGKFHPACPVYVDCEASLREAAVGSPGEPVCRVAGAAAQDGALSWEQGGVACPPVEGSYPLPCRPATVSCEAGALVPLEDGVCPVEEGVEDCGGSFLDDLDCDGRIPACPDPEGCVPDEPCGDTGCGRTVCNPDDTSECFQPREVCDGVDEDCDGLRDDEDRDAIGTCNARRPVDQPRADGCLLGACSCGGERACADGLRCCPDAGCQAVDAPCRVTDEAR